MADPVDAVMAADRPSDLEFDPVARRIWDHFEQAKDYRKQFDKDWSRFYLLYAGRHWDGRQAEWQATPVINLTYSVINTIVPILTDSRPQISVVPRLPEHDAIAEVIGSIVEWVWERNNMESELPKVMTNAMIFGNAFCKVLWDPTLGTLGDIKIAHVDPTHIFVAPHARSLDEADYVIHAENMTVGRVRRMFPDAFIPEAQQGPDAPELSLERNVTSQVGGGAGGAGVVWTRDTNTAGTGSGSNLTGYNAGRTGHGASDSDEVTVLECWERDATGGIRQIVVVNNKVILDQPSPFGHSMMPFVQFVDTPHTWSLWAMGEVQQVEKLQIEINRRRGHIQDILRYSAAPILVVDPASGVEYETIAARPGLVIPAEGGLQSIGWLQSPSVPTALFEVNQLDKADFDVVLGNVDVLQGRRPEGVEAGVALELLHEAANVRMRAKVRHMENSLKRLGELVVAMSQQFYTTERVFAVSGMRSMSSVAPAPPDGVNPAGAQPQSGYQFIKINSPQGMDPMTGMPILQNAMPGLDEATFDVRIGAGSTLPVSRAAQFQKAITLFSMGVADDQVVWENSGFPHWREEMARSRMWQMQRQMMMAQQAPAGAPAEEPLPEDEMSDDEFQAMMAEGAAPDQNQPGPNSM